MLALALAATVEDAKIQEKNPGGRPEKVKDEDALTNKDLEIMALLAAGCSQEVAAGLAGIDRKTIHRNLDSGRLRRFTKAARERVESIAVIAADIIHAELKKGNVEVAMQVLKGLNIMKLSVNAPKEKTKERSIAEETVDNEGRTTRRVIREREVEGD